MVGIEKNSGNETRKRLILAMSFLLISFALILLTGCTESSGSDDSTDDSVISDTNNDGGDSDGGDDTGGSDTNDDGGDSDGDDDSGGTDTGDDGDVSDDGDTDDGDDADSEEVGYDEGDYTWSASEVIQISLNGNSITENASGATAVGSELAITSSGTYRLTGTLNDGRIIVNTKKEDEDVVRLIFDGVDISCSDSAPIYIQDSLRTAIILQAGTQNHVSDATAYAFEGDEDEPNAAIYSKDYLTIGGNGSLTVNGNYNDGITSKDGLAINSGTITVNAVDDGIRGKDWLIIKNGSITVTTDSGDGLLSDKEEDTERGYIIIEDGEFDISSGEDAIQAETYVTVYDGDFTLISGGGSGTSFSEDDSKKGIKGVAGVVIDDGYFSIDSADDAVHSNDFVEIDGGLFDIYTGDDGIHADNTLEIYGGDFSIWESYEGIESSVITIGDGNVYIESSDDGLNCAGGNDGSGFEGPGGGFTPSAGGNYALYIDGGYIAMYAQGDGLDSNGNIEMTGGTVLVHGPTSDWNGALDYMGSFSITGGLLAAVGSSGMAEAPSQTSTQYSVLLNFTEKDAGALFHIETEGGEEILTFKPSKRYESVVFSSPELENGVSYNVYSDGSCTGSETDGLYLNGEYTPGTADTDLDFTISSVVTTVGAGSGGGPGGGGPGGGRGG